MNPGPTFDRVYASLKDQLRSGRWPPGAHLEPAAIGADLAASITPVRDALHRLVGERLVEAPRHDGFWVPSPTETELAGLYAWNADLVAWALRRRRRALPTQATAGGSPVDVAGLFLALADSAGSEELLHAVAGSLDRLAAYRAVEPEVLPQASAELDEIGVCLGAGNTGALRRALNRYHRRRQRAAPLILAARRRTNDLQSHR